MTAVRARQRRYVWAAALALLLALAAVGWTQWRQHELLDSTVQYQNDYLQISLAQLQIEYLRLHGALQTAVQADVPDRDAVQLRYDIFVSRVDLLDSERVRRLVPDKAEFARVLAGVQVPPADAAEFEQHLRDLQYAYTEETGNPAYRMFLGG